LSRVGAEGVGSITVFKQRVFNCGAMNRTQQRSTQHRQPIMWKVECPVVETLEEQQEAENCRYSNEGKKPGLSQRVIRTLRQIQQWGGKCQGVVGTDPNQPAISNCRSMKPINANAPCKATNAHPPNWNQRVKFHCASGPHKIAMSVPCYLRGCSRQLSGRSR